MARSENLTIMFTDMVNFTERTSRQSRAENQAMLRQHDALLLPLVSRFGGRRVKSIGDALLITFRSPTNAVQCGMAMQDALAEFNQGRAEDAQIHIRVAINVGEVRAEARDVFGEPVNVAARVEGLTPPDEIYFTEAVHLAMNKAEVPFEPVGSKKLKGIPESIRVFRVPPRRIARLVPGGEHLESQPGELPFGGMHKLAPARPITVLGRELPRSAGFRPHLLQAGRLALLGSGAGALVIAAVFGLAPMLSPQAQGVVEPAAPAAVVAPAPVAADGAQARRARLQRMREARLAMERGHALFATDRRAAAVAYGEALAADPKLRDDATLAANLVACLSWGAEAAIPVIRANPSPAIVAALAERTAGSGAQGRARAAGLLRDLGESARIDETGIALADLAEASDCDARRSAVVRLGQLRQPRALPALRELRGSGVKAWWRNRCLGSELKSAINELERIAPPS